MNTRMRLDTNIVCVYKIDKLLLSLASIIIFLNQQFITWSVKADHGSYFITTYR